MATCGHCGYESDDLATCPLCGTANAASTATADATMAVAALPAWEHPDTSFPRNLFDTWRRSMFDPGRFFAGAPHEAPALRPILYFMIVTIMGAGFTLWWSAAFSTVQTPLLEMLTGLSDPAGADLGAPLISPLLTFFLTPFFAIVVLALWGLWLHLFVMMFARNRRNITATYRSACYASGPSLLTAVPLVGSFVGFVWSVVMTVFAIRAAHRMTTGTAAAAVLIATFLPLVLFVGFLIVVFAAVASIGV